jgi:hypothetical protein
LDSALAGSSGADQLVTSALGIALAKYYKSRPKLQNTRVVFASFDAEENCLRGSRAFFKKHRKEFHQTKTWSFTVDSPYSAENMQFLTTDMNGFVKLSGRMAQRLVEIAHEKGYSKAKLKGMKPFGGSTDAAEAAKVGVEATCLVGVRAAPKDARGRRNVYQGRRDSMEPIDREVIEAAMEVFVQFVQDVDEGKLA